MDPRKKQMVQAIINILITSTFGSGPDNNTELLGLSGKFSSTGEFYKHLIEGSK
jgi:hypothetical protein